MDTSLGSRTIVWGSIGADLVAVAYDLRYMVMCSVALILTDLWWGYSESSLRFEQAKAAGNATLQDKYKWHKSRAGRRTANKIVDYCTYMICGAFFGLAITEPMGMCDHIWTAAAGLGLGCACEIASITGHVVFVKMGVELKVIDAWRVVVRFIGRLFKVKSQEIGDAIEGLGDDLTKKGE